jgi:hypothetical protein
MALTSSMASKMISQNSKQALSNDPGKHKGFADIQRKYSCDARMMTPPTRPGTGEEEEGPVDVTVTEITEITPNSCVNTPKLPQIEQEWPPADKPLPLLRRLSIIVTSFISSSSKIATEITRRRASAPDILTVNSTPDSPRGKEYDKKVYKYMNGPLASKETKSFRHGVAAQQGNNVDLDNYRSKNAKYMMSYSEKAREDGISSAMAKYDSNGSNLTSPILHEPDLTDNERAKRQRGFDAALRQYKGGKKTKDKLIKAYSYGSGARHEE